MLIFWIVAMILVAFTLTFVLLPLLKPNTKVVEEGHNERVVVFQQQFDEIAQDKANGVLNEAQYEVAKTELERRMLNEVGTKVSTFKAVKQDRILAIAFTVLLPLLSILIYFKIGNPDSITIPPAVSSFENNTSSVEHNAMGGDIEPLLNGLKAKLEKNPEDGEGWALLARTYVELRRHSEAVIAYEKATQLITDDPQLYADYADALGVVKGQTLVGEPEDLINKALAIDPHHEKALMLAGTVAYDKKEYTNAISLWEHLKKVLSPESELLPDVKAALAETYSIAGINPPAPQPQEIIDKSSEITSASIGGTVSIAPELANKVSPIDTVFIFARPAQGKNMPLAVDRVAAKELPYKFMLDDSKALIPNHKLSQASEVVLVARVSKTGDATSKPGDLEGMSALVKPNGATVNIEINEMIE